ncbi:MAG: methionine gamma-lyase family protein [Oscillospiraceae bacterium]|nr:methionine gamma-lyase family protein [Oscillospiraceae bacterium]
MNYDAVLKASHKALDICKDNFERIEEICLKNSQKVLKSFIENKVSTNHFSRSTGYGYYNTGKEVLNSVFAQVLGAEHALVSANFASGTHAIVVTLSAVLRPGDLVISVTGEPYDTLNTFIYGENCGSLSDFNINFEKINVFDGFFSFESKIWKDSLQKKPKVVYIQRSRGYTFRKSMSIQDIEDLVKNVRKISPKSIVIVDNCYGELVQTQEPTEIGADLVVGSLIKNLGGGIASSGAYVAGKKDLIELCCQRFISPGISHTGASYLNQELFMGLFYSPAAVKEALKTSVFASALFEILGLEVLPKYSELRTDLVQIIKLKSKKNLISFCKAIQFNSPIDSFLEPLPWAMPGYKDEIIMASGGFISGSSIEISADAPLREPFAVWLQGGTNFYMSTKAILAAAEAIEI